MLTMLGLGLALDEGHAHDAGLGARLGRRLGQLMLMMLPLVCLDACAVACRALCGEVFGATLTRAFQDFLGSMFSWQAPMQVWAVMTCYLCYHGSFLCRGA